MRKDKSRGIFSLKILFLGNPSSVFVKELMVRLKKKRSDFDLTLISLSAEQDLLENEYYKRNKINIVYPSKSFPGIFYKIPKLRVVLFLFDLELFLRRNKFDICNLHFVSWFMGLVSNSIKNCCSKLIVSFWGSDFYHSNSFQKWIQGNLIKRASYITATNMVTLDQVKKSFQIGPQVKTEIIRFGLVPLENIGKHLGNSKEYFKKQLDLPPDSTVITCGYHGREDHQHLRIIDSITSVREQLPGNIILLFPMTYGLTHGYRNKIQQGLEKLGLPYRILDRFLSNDKIAVLRLATDIMINVPISDQFSGSMQEHLFAGNTVITGSWLPYDKLFESGISMLKVSCLDEVGEKLLEALRITTRGQTHTDYSTIIWNLSSWEKNIDKWIECYEKT